METVEEEKKPEEEVKKKPVAKSRVMSYYGPRWVTVLSVILPIFGAAGFPAFGWLFTRVIFVIMQPQRDDYRERVNMESLYFAIVACGMGLFRYLQGRIYTTGGENCIFSIRKVLYESILHK